ncbi:DUF2225 domain-containing protein [Bacillus benzoevorans]|uniref:DUF2225 domain-containing protein n=1 Tax=Bacillus benzoevorans TaxID=1456 RepID=A0A7X0HQC7_9BACI|nr:DUF2225 domain-containing protein [Bacillus benzoevorans]MBB6445005.1 hypothetical protein [Bacillus benzoevorans]
MTVLEALFDKKCTCHLCGHRFTSKKIRSRYIKCLNHDTDFCPNYEDIEHNPLLYTIYVCPDCGYSFSDDSTPPITTTVKKILEEKIRKNWTPRSYSDKRTIDDAITAYKLAFYCSTLKKEKHVVIAGISLRIAWLNRLQQNCEQEQRFMAIALHEYTEAYNTLDFLGTQLTELKVLYLLGELSRRTDKTAEARKYFSKVIEKQRTSAELRIIEMAKERWREMRDSS